MKKVVLFLCFAGAILIFVWSLFRSDDSSSSSPSPESSVPPTVQTPYTPVEQPPAPSSEPSSSSAKSNPGETKRLNDYESINEGYLHGDKAQKQKAISDLLNKMQSGEIPLDATQDYRNLKQKYNH
jgi:hypothetical protein